MYTYEEFATFVGNFLLEKHKLRSDSAVVQFFLRKLSHYELREMYDNIHKIVPFENLMDYFNIFTFVKYFSNINEFSNFNPIDIYKIYINSPNLSINDIREIYGHLYAILDRTIYDIQYNTFNRFSHSRKYIGGKVIARKIVKKINESNKTYEEIFNIFSKECIRINNKRVSKFSLLWWERLNDYTEWIPQEIHDDMLILLDEKSYLTFV